MSKLIIILTVIELIISFCIADNYITEKPTYIKGCEIKKPEFVKCSTESIQKLFTQMAIGIPGLKSLQTIDPLDINKIQINQEGNNAVNIKVDLTKISVSGFAKTVVKESRVSSKDYSWRTKLHLPKMKIDGNYAVQGRILLIPLNGHGKIILEAENMDIVLYTKTRLYEKGGLTFYNVTNTRVDYAITGLKSRLDNLFNGNKELEESTNQFFNDNWQPVAEALKPVITKTVEEILLDILQRIFHYIPAEYLVVDIPKPSELYDKI